MSLPKCFLCGSETDSQLVRSTLPKELLGKDDYGNLVSDDQPFCRRCFYFKRVVDLNFIKLCEDAKLFEWYRSKSKKRGEYFPPELVYHIDIDRLRELYYAIFTVCLDADKVASDEQARKDKEEELNYLWRKRDA